MNVVSDVDVGDKDDDGDGFRTFFSFYSNGNWYKCNVLYTVIIATSKFIFARYIKIYFTTTI